MLRTRLLTATAAVALFAASAAFAQSAPTMPQAAPMTAPTTAPAVPQTPQTMPAEAASPQATTTATPAQAAAATPAVAGNVIDTLKANGQFTVLLTALESAQLTDTLKNQPAISIFAPTDAAFAKLPEAERTRLMDPANVNDLRQLLLYHVVVADVKSSQIEGTKGGVETAARTQVQLDGTGNVIKVDGATVTTADIDASNGAVFAIDSVLNPAASAVASGDADEAAAPVTEAAPAAPVAAPTPPPATNTARPSDEPTPPADQAPTEATPPAPTPPVEGDPAKTDPAAPAPTPVPTPQG